MQLTWILSLLLAVVNCLAFRPSADWENTQFKRSIDLTNSYVKEKYQLTVKNIADLPIDTYYFALPNYVFDKISGYNVASLASTDPKKKIGLETELVEELSTEINNEPLIKYIKVKFPQPISPKSTTHLLINLIISDFVEPLPAKIGLNDPQTLLLRSVKKPLSAYKTKTGSELIISGVTDAQELPLEGQEIEIKGTVEDDLIKYKFDDGFESFTLSTLPLVYSHNAPLTKVVKLDRGIWVSHWADSLQFEEFYELTNKAAVLKNGFSRAEFMKNKQAFKQTHGLAVLELNLNDDSEDVYYTDLVGNVSTSRAFSDKLYIRPRYPVFGGWNYNFTVGWTNKLNNFLSTIKGSDEYQLTVPLLNGPGDATYDEVALSFYLPEGSEFLNIDSPIEYDSIVEGNEFSYLDLNNGHTKITVIYNKLVDELRSAQITITYKYTTFNLLQKPLNVAKLLLIGLISYFVLTKIDVSLKAKK